MTTWLVVAALGAYHGLNPAMGWLFAVALGMQDRRESAVLRAILPLAAGHALSVGAVVLLAVAASVVVPADVLRTAGAGVLLAFAAFLLRRSRHPRANGIGMRPGAGDLTFWSFIMSSAHGSGLMLLPVMLHTSAPRAAEVEVSNATAHAVHGTGAHGIVLHELAAPDPAVSPAAAALAGFGETFAILMAHTGAMLAAMTVAALLTYRVLGLGFLRRAWLNLDIVWVGSLVVAAAVTLLG
ncbi:MAG TPA: hypothetical protein VFZ69_16425 [Longimicrobiales bacterium]